MLEALTIDLKREFGSQFQIEAAESVVEAIELLDECIEEEEEIAVVIVDYLLPGIKGDELLIHIHKTLPDTVKILLTGQVGFEGLSNAINHANLYRYITKPWDRTDFIMTVKEATTSFSQKKTIMSQNQQLQQLNRQLAEINQDLEEKVQQRTEQIFKMERLLRLSYERRRRNDLLNEVITGKINNVESILVAARRIHLDLTANFSFFLIRIVRCQGESFSHTEQISSNDQIFIDAVIDHCSTNPSLIAWDTCQGIGCLYIVDGANDDGEQEMIHAHQLRKQLMEAFPESEIAIGIAAFKTGIMQMDQRFRQARDSVTIGMRIHPNDGCYHFYKSGVFPILAPLSGQEEVEDFLARTIDKILDYDRKKGNSLFQTLEKIVFSNSLREVAESMFLHYKTIIFRKQAIEKILGFSLESFEGRITIGTALTLHYLREKAIDSE